MIVPYTATGRLSLIFTPITRQRKMRIPCALILPLTTPTQFVIRNPAGGNVAASAAALALWNLVKPFYNVTTNPPTYLVEQNFSGVFVPVESAALAGLGTNGSANAAAFVDTFTFRSILGHRLKFLMIETVNGTLYHQNLAGSGAAAQAFINNVLAFTNPTDIGNWAVARGNEIIKSFTFHTSSANKRLRRQYGLT